MSVVSSINSWLRREGVRWRGKRRNQLLDDIEEKRRYWYLKKNKLDSSLRRTHFGRGYGLLSRRTTQWMNDYVSDRLDNLSRHPRINGRKTLSSSPRLACKLESLRALTHVKTQQAFNFADPQNFSERLQLTVLENDFVLDIPLTCN
jgi:hypothetical protein